jgi:hypothetical protein
VPGAAYGRIANTRAGKPSPFFTFGHVTTINAPLGGTPHAKGHATGD